jgi:hypothetical protein
MKLGRRAPRHTLRTIRSAVALAYALDPLGAPPAASDDYVSAVDKLTGGNWGVDLNDQLGDCVIADSAHQVMLHTANAGNMVTPTDAEVLEMYEVVGGYKPGDPSTDQGCDEGQACQYLMATGLADQKSAGTGFVDPANMDHIRWTVQLFGACRLGISVTDAMMQAFNAGQPWTSMTGNIEGGHDVPVVRYDGDYAWVVTWGKLQPIAWALMANAAFLDEAHAEVWPDFLAATGTAPNGFNLKGLLAALPDVEMQ